MYIAMARRKVGSAADYIIPGAVVIGIGYALWKLFGSSSSGGGGGLPAAANTAINNTFASSPAATQTATMATATTLDAWYQTQYDATNPFLANLYNSNNGCATISQAIANDLFTTMYTAANADAFFKPDPDLSTILSQWQQYVKNQCDVSFIAASCVQMAGTSLWAFMEKYFENDRTGSSGQTNVTMLWALVQWVSSLPVGLPQD